MKNIDALIADLSRQPPAQAAQRRLLPSYAMWLVVVCAYIAFLLTFAFRPRADLAVKLSEPLFLFEISSLALLALTSALGAVLLSFPDFYQKRGLCYAPLGAAALFIAALLMESLAAAPAPEPAHAMECCLAITAAALPLAALMFAHMRRMAPTRPRLAAATAVLASFSIGALALRLSEATDSIRHIIIWHYLPMILMGVIGLWLGRRLLRW